MAQKTTTTKNIDNDVAQELEKALDIDLSNDGGDLDIASQFADLEAQISQAAEELARESKPAESPQQAQVQPQPPARPVPMAANNGKPAAAPAAAATSAPKASELRPVQPLPSLQPAGGFSAANDDRQRDYRQLIHSFNRRAPSTIYWMVLLLSLAWIAGGAGLAQMLVGPEVWNIRTADQFMAEPILAVIAIGVLVPLILFWGFAVMIRRAQELRLAARSMTEVAIKLAEPENLAQDRVMMVGQAVRREVAAMGEGIERTLARAVELETLVHTEVNELERAYTQNETRIRNLVDGLGAERDAVVTHSERVRASITGAHETLREEISSVSDIIRDSILSASTKLSLTITNSGDTLIDRINESGAGIYESIDQRTATITDRISTSGEAFASLLDTRIARLTESVDHTTRSLSDLLDERTTGMVSLLSGATRSINSEFDSRIEGIERTLSERGQALISEFQTRAEALDVGTQKLNAALEARARQINEALVERAREIASTFSEGRANLSSMIDEGKARIGAEMSDIVTSTSTMLEARASDFAGRLDAARHVVSRSFDSDIERLHEARTEIDEAVVGHARKLAESRDRLSAAIQADLQKFSDSRLGIDEAMNAHTQKLSEARTTIDGAVENQLIKLNAGRHNLTQALEDDLRQLDLARANIDQMVAGHVGKLAEGRGILTRALEADLSKLAESRSGIDGLVAGQVEKLAQGRDILTRALESDLNKLGEARANIDESVAGHVGKLAEGRNMLARALEDDARKLSDVRTAIDVQLKGHIDTLAEKRGEISEAVSADVAKIEEAFRHQTGVIEERTGTMERALGAGVENVRNVLEKSAMVVAGALREKVLEVTSALSEEAGKAFTDADRQIAERAEATSAALMARVGEIARTFDETDRSLVARATETALALAARAAETAEALAARTTETAEALAARATETAETLAARSTDILNNFDSADQQLSARISESAGALAARTAELSRIFDAADQRLASRITESDASLSARAADIVKSFEDADDRLASRVNDTADAIAARASGLANIFDDTEQRIIARTHQTSAELDARARAIEEVLATRALAIQETLTTSARDVEDTFSTSVRTVEEALNAADERMASGASSAAARVSSHMADAERRLSYSAEQLTQKINDQVSQAEAQLISRADAIAETFQAVGQHIGQSTNEAARTIGVNTRELNNLLAQRSAEIAKILDETARPLVERFAQGGGELQKSLQEAAQQATEQLRVENAALVNALASRTSETLQAMDGARGQLAESVTELIDRLSASSVQLSELIELAEKNLIGVDEKLASTTTRFATATDRAAQTFASSSRLIDDNTSRLTDLSTATLREVAGIATRFDEHSRLLSSASNLLTSAQSNLEHTLERQTSLEDLAVGLVQKSEQLEKVMKSFENLVGSSLERAEGRTLESTERIKTSITEVVDAATQRFANATEDLRRTAGEIRSELEHTRAELRQGVIDMPVEAKESTSAIRNAVSEQIKALKELSDIVARSGRTIDVSEPRAVRTGSGPVQSAPVQAPVMRSPEPPRRAAQPAERRPERDLGIRPTLEMDQPAEAPRQREQAPQGGQPGGWVRDLLRGASREEEAVKRPAGRTIAVADSLNSLSVDIARAIDHDAAIELWDRYRRGERDVFTRRLYTLKGQQTFDEIRRRYHADPDFHGAVDRYCDDFERLLAEVSRNDRDNIMAQTYLSSDTGKVYTMLAHAAGRLH